MSSIITCKNVHWIEDNDSHILSHILNILNKYNVDYFGMSKEFFLAYLEAHHFMVLLDNFISLIWCSCSRTQCYIQTKKQHHRRYVKEMYCFCFPITILSLFKEVSLSKLSLPPFSAFLCTPPPPYTLCSFGWMKLILSSEVGTWPSIGQSVYDTLNSPYYQFRDMWVTNENIPQGFCQTIGKVVSLNRGC